MSSTFNRAQAAPVSQPNDDHHKSSQSWSCVVMQLNKMFLTVKVEPVLRVNFHIADPRINLLLVQC